jgi:hypothetical protein
MAEMVGVLGVEFERIQVAHVDERRGGPERRSTSQRLG